MRASVLECTNLRHAFGKGDLVEPVLRGISVAFAPGETCLLMGPSGSGKTTFLSILGCMLRPTQGELRLQGVSVNWSNQQHLTALRRQCLGFVFQHAQLLPFLSVQDNLVVVGRNAGLRPLELVTRTRELLERLELMPCQHKMPNQLSGGQRQRVAIARAVLHRPAVILADEPTAALDWDHGEAVIRLLVEQAHVNETMLLTVTHDVRLKPYFSRTLALQRGELMEEES